MSKPVCAVVGVGPGLGEAYCRAFAEAGYAVAVLSRTPDEALADELGGVALSCDATRDDSVRSALSAVAEQLGPIDTLIWNVGGAAWGDIDKVDVDGLELGWRTNCRGLFVATQTVLPGMREAGSGNVIVTGATASLRGKPFTTAFAPGKAAQRSLCQSLARTLWPEGIHVALLIIDGMVDLPATRERMPDKGDEVFVSPAGTAAIALSLVNQDRRAWSFEVEVRPNVENW